MPQERIQTQSFGKELTNLAKIYTDGSKYSGDNDNFDFKLVIFHDLCNRADVPEEAKVKAYPTMLRGLALDYYYTNLKNVAQTLSFDQICDATRHYFEGPEYRRGILGQWNSTTLKSVISKGENTGKSTLDCLQLLIKELRHLQHGLDPDLRTDKFLHNKLINACQELPACQYARFKPSDSLAGLIKAKMLVGVDILDIEGNTQIRRSVHASKKQKRLDRLLCRMSQIPRMLRLPRLLQIPQMFRPSHPLRVFRPPCLRDLRRLSYCSIHLPT
jgi:hypothetical protein